jgi:hypothetical protein
MGRRKTLKIIVRWCREEAIIMALNASTRRLNTIDRDDPQEKYL